MQLQSRPRKRPVIDRLLRRALTSAPSRALLAPTEMLVIERKGDSRCAVDPIVSKGLGNCRPRLLLVRDSGTAGDLPDMCIAHCEHRACKQPKPGGCEEQKVVVVLPLFCLAEHPWLGAASDGAAEGLVTGSGAGPSLQHPSRAG
jgi:hypothetical protein